MLVDGVEEKRTRIRVTWTVRSCHPLHKQCYVYDIDMGMGILHIEKSRVQTVEYIADFFSTCRWEREHHEARLVWV